MSAAQEKVQAALQRLVDAGWERGAQIAVYRDGELLVDAWAGVADSLTGEAVTGDTVFPVFSVTKGIAATVVHQLAERGKLSYDLRIAEVWPEFGVNGKEGITVEHALRHTAGLPLLPEGLTFSQMLDWETACAAVARMTPHWPPGMRFAYHAKTYGWLVGEVARRVDGRFFTDIVRDEIATPLGLKTLHVGLGETGGHRVAFLEEEGVLVERPSFAPDVLAAQVTGTHQMNSPAMWAACLPSSNGLMSARAIARHYAALLPGGVDGVELLPPSRVTEAIRWETRNDPAGNPSTRGLGYQLVECAPGSRTAIRGFGHWGYGGSLGFAAPKRRMAIACVRNRFTPQTHWDGILAEMLEEFE